MSDFSHENIKEFKVSHLGYIPVGYISKSLGGLDVDKAERICREGEVELDN